MGKDKNGKELGTGITQRADGTYCGRYVDRFNNRKCVYSKNIRELKKKLNEAISDDKKLLSIRGNVTLDEWYGTWFEVYKRYSVKPSTLREYDYIYRHDISPRLGKMKLTAIYKTHVQAVVNELHLAGYGYERQDKVRMIMSDICNRAIEDQYLIINPAKGVRTRAKKPKGGEALTREEQKDFFEWAKFSFFYNAFVVHVNTGLRPGELFALTKEDIDMGSGMINVAHTLVYEKYLDDECKTFHLESPKTDASYRNLPMNSVCKEYIQKQIELKERMDIKFPTGCPYLFVSSVNHPIEATIYNDAIAMVIRYMNFQRLREDEMARFSGHTLRHTFATRCFEAGIPPKVVQKYLGHATLQMTMDLYVHVMQDVKATDIEKICADDFYEGAEYSMDEIMKNGVVVA